MSGRFKLCHSGDGFRFDLVAGNGETILSSQKYASKEGAQKGIASVKSNAADDERYDRRTSKAEQPYFALKAANGEIIGTSQMYASPDTLETGIASVKSHAPDAEIEDQTA